MGITMDMPEEASVVVVAMVAAAAAKEAIEAAVIAPTIMATTPPPPPRPNSTPMAFPATEAFGRKRSHDRSSRSRGKSRAGWIDSPPASVPPITRIW